MNEAFGSLDTGKNKEDDRSKEKSSKAGTGTTSSNAETAKPPERKPAFQAPQSWWQKMVQPPTFGGEQGPKPEKKDDKPSAVSLGKHEPDSEAAEKTREATETKEVTKSDVSPELKQNVAETAQSLTKLDEPEKAKVLEDYLDGRLANIRSQKAEQPSLNEAKADTADEAFLEGVQAKMLDGGLTAEDAIDETYREQTGEEIPVPETATEAKPEADAAGLPEDGNVDMTMEYEDPLDEDIALPPAYGAAGGSPPLGVGYAGPGEGGFGPDTPNVLSVIGNWNAEPEVETREVGTGIGGVLVGGIIGYLLGRRRGRIRSEHQLLPIQKGLEQQVRALHDHIALREAQVRQLVWERADAERPTTATLTSKRYEAPIAQTIRPEQAPPAALVNPEIRSPEAAKASPRSAEKLHIDDVLRISETITVGSTTIRNVYETNLISERGLRRVVEAHLRGEDVRRVLTEELLVKEISHELDPRLRDRPVSELAAPRGGGSQGDGFGSSANDLDSATSSAASAATDSTQTGRTAETNQPKITSMLLIANIAALVVLGALLVVLFVVWVTHSF